jgi:HPt (histidine-containing phosphotransfer) domain-containing protein
MGISTADGEAVYSSLGGDPLMSELVDMYVAEMPDRIAALEQAFSSGDRAVLQRAVHQMKGAAGSYGFDPLTMSAIVLEAAIFDNQSPETILRSFGELIQLCRRVRTGIAPA